MKQTLSYTVTLLSDTCCGVGTGNGSDVDIRSASDRYGLPVLPAKRLRGLLRENAMLLTEKYGEDAVLSLFGDSGAPSRLRLEDARIPNAEEIGRFLLANGKNPRQISGVFTGKRQQTAIDEETGIARKGSLRIIETVKRGTVFTGTAEIRDGTDDDIRLLCDCFRLLRFIGLCKHRGLGEVSCTAESQKQEEKTAAVPETYTPTDDFCAAEYRLYAEQDIALMLNSPTAHPDYLSGALLQGVFASVLADKPYFDSLFFDSLRFCSAYRSDGERTMPAPFSITAVKNKGDTVYDLADGYQRDASCQYVSVSGYLGRGKNTVTRYTVSTQTDYHINTGAGNKADKTFFQTELLQRGQTFVGKIYGCSAALRLLKHTAQTCFACGITVGSGLDAQYGRCTLTIGEPTSVPAAAFRQGDTVVVNAVSDVILTDAMGNPSLDPEDFRAELGGDDLRVRLDNTGLQMIYVRNGVAGGYNRKWGMPKMQYHTISRGSVMVFDCLSDCVLPRFVGIGTEEGYGELAFRKQEKPQPLTVRKAEAAVDDIPVAEIPTAKELLQKIEAAERQKDIVLRALCDAETAHTGALSNSAAMRLLNLWQAMEKPVKVNTFTAQTGDFTQSTELKKLTETICNGFEKVGKCEDAEFDLYLRTFLGKYKEIHMDIQNEKSAEKDGNRT